jgi:putative hemolysin
MTTEILIISLLLVLNAFFALSELAIVSASKPLLKQYIKKGKSSAQIALNLAENSGRFLSTIQVGITLVGTLAGAYGGTNIADKLIDPFNQIPIFNPHGEMIAVVLVVSCITYFSVVIGELVPKQVALSNATNIAMIVAPLMYILSNIFTPIVWVLEMSAKILLTILGVNAQEEKMTEIEIQAVIAEGVSSGAIEEDEQKVIQRVIRLGDRDIKSIMTHRGDVKFVDVDDTLEQVRNKIKDAGHSRYPVIDKDTTKILGIVKTKELMAQAPSNNYFNVKNHIQDILFFQENATCLEALNQFRTKSTHIAAVIDEYGSFEGVFTTSDLMEAIVGIIPSNYDVGDEPLIIQRDDKSWLVDGLTPIEEINMSIGLEDIATDDDYQTIAGFVLSKISTNPYSGLSFDFMGYRFEIIDMDRHRIDKILIEKME